MEDQNAILVPILNDADLSTAAAAAEQIVYGQPLPFVYRAKHLTAYIDIYFLSPGGTATIKVLGQYTIDGVNWVDFANPILSTTAGGVRVSAEYTITTEFGPLVRFNVSLKDAAGAASARLSGVVKVVFYN